MTTTSLKARLRGRIDKKVNADVLNQQLGIETLRRHSHFNATNDGLVHNDDGSVSSVRSGSVEDKRLNNGRPTLIPFVYDGKVVDVKEAVKRAVESKGVFPAFDTNEEATAASIKISDSL